MACALCGTDVPAGELTRVSGLDLCDPCRTRDPADALRQAGFAVEWNTSRMWFHAGIGIPGGGPAFQLGCRPELWMHKAAKLLIHEVEVGDPLFDGKIFVRTSDPEGAKALLASEGLQSALLALLTGTRNNELGTNHVTVDKGSLTASIRPLDGLPDDKIHELKLELAVLALHLRDWS